MSQSVVNAVGAALASHAQGVVAEFGDDEFDYIVIGAGSSGCVIANRLSADENASVLLLEAGGPDNDPRLQNFTRCGDLQKSEFDWKYQTEQEPGLQNRRIDWPRGKVFGGSSSINFMIYIRGHRSDYDHWKFLGNDGWDYESLLPYFIKSENNESIEDRFHGNSGELNVAESPARNQLGPAFLTAAKQIGFDANDRWDFNGKQQEGVAGYYQHTVKNGKRCSAAAAFLTPILGKRKNLDARPWSFVTRLLFEKTRVRGAEYVALDGSIHHVAARREVIVCAGAVDSPQLLLLSGIGPADHLRQHEIEVVNDLPGVGRNLQDHLVLGPRYEAKVKPHDGAIPCGGLFLRSGDPHGSSTPDLQFHPYSFADESGKNVLSFGVTLARPRSVGRIQLFSKDPRIAPRIEANYLERGRDCATLVRGIEIAKELAKSDSLSRLLGEVEPAFRGKKTRSELEEVVRAKASTIYHPIGTCKMGHDYLAVVDQELRVRGIKGLRVADASIMPTIVNGNTNAPCIMIGEKAADLILQG